MENIENELELIVKTQITLNKKKEDLLKNIENMIIKFLKIL